MKYEAGGLDDRIGAILSACREQNVPVVFALSRRSLGVAYRSSGRAQLVSVIGLLLLDDILVQFKVTVVCAQR
jgi:predicted TIM-barrel fold metal-dependent hydrolase